MKGSDRTDRDIKRQTRNKLNRCSTVQPGHATINDKRRSSSATTLCVCVLCCVVLCFVVLCCVVLCVCVCVVLCCVVLCCVVCVCVCVL